MSGYDYRHFAAFENLCWEAERRRGLQVRLCVGEPVQFARRHVDYYRQLTAIELWSNPPFDPAERQTFGRVEVIPIYDDDIESAALAACELLARAA